MLLGMLIKEYRQQNGVTMEEFAKKCGFSKGYISMIERGKNPKTGRPIAPTLKAYDAIAGAMGLTLNELLKKVDDTVSLEPTSIEPVGSDLGDVIALPIIASIAAGYDGLAEEYENETAEIPIRMLKGYSRDEIKVVRVKGNSMYPQLCNGDLVVMHVQTSVDPGDIAVVVYNGEEATIKKVNYVYGEDWMELIPANPEYMTRRIEGVDLEQCKVIGRVLSLIRDF